MKSFFTLFLSIMLMHMMSGQAVITAAFDCTLPGGTPKGIEVYITQDISDLTLLGVSSANNGTGATGTPEYTLPSGTATAGQYIYISTEADNFLAWFGFAADYVDDANGSMNINGDDAIELFYNGVVIDVFGDVDMDGSGMPWEYLDGWAARLPSTGPDGSTFVISNWNFSVPDALDGETSNATAANPVPLKSYTGGMVSPDHSVDVSGFVFTPDLLVVRKGDIVQWDNTDGNHNVNGSLATFPGNSEDFFSGTPAPAPWSFQHTFNNPGYNEYQCDLHAGVGMTGGVLVEEEGDHYIKVENNFYDPADITIEIGETVVWTNISGFHNVNGTTATYPGNPESFGNGAPSLNWSYAHTFTIPGVYDYQCDPHVGFGMVGKVTVTTAYTPVDMATVKQIDGDGNALYVDSLVRLVGVVHGPNYRSSGVEFFLIDGNNDGVLIRTTSSDPAYTVTEGDELTVSGEVNQFNGFIQVVPDVIAINSTGNALNIPDEVDAPSEDTEGSFIIIKGLTLVDTSEWPDDDMSANVRALKGIDTIVIRVDFDIEFDIPAPLGVFDVLGLGNQFDNSDPRTEGYQILPRSAMDIMEVVGTKSIADIGITNIYPNPVKSELFIESEYEILEVVVYDILGKQVEQFNNLDQQTRLTFTSNLTAGVYILKARTEKGYGTTLFLKE